MFFSNKKIYFSLCLSITTMLLIVHILEVRAQISYDYSNYSFSHNNDDSSTYIVIIPTPENFFSLGVRKVPDIDSTSNDYLTKISPYTNWDLTDPPYFTVPYRFPTYNYFPPMNTINYISPISDFSFSPFNILSPFSWQQSSMFYPTFQNP